MKPRTAHRLRYALRLLASVCFMSSPCSGATIDSTPVAVSIALAG